MREGDFLKVFAIFFYETRIIVYPIRKVEPSSSNYCQLLDARKSCIHSYLPV